MPTSSTIGPPAAGLRSAPLDGRLLPTLPTVSSTSLLLLQPSPGAGADRLASPALPTPRRPRRLRRARVARCSSGACSAGCAAQPDSLRTLLMRRGAAGGTAAAHAALWASPSCLAASPTPLAARGCPVGHGAPPVLSEGRRAHGRVGGASVSWTMRVSKEDCRSRRTCDEPDPGCDAYAPPIGADLAPARVQLLKLFAVPRDWVD